MQEESKKMKLLKETCTIHLEDYTKLVAQKIEIDGYCISELLKESDVILLSQNSFAKFQKLIKTMSLPIIIADDSH
eukprot:CAMPEP_0170563672 /NCGR_PEP_ID=MMETSP0211-20121228/68098_1 /TAXON_ID=311385 /ORGANISM="Pseudokeronopsis sp., Strain OXSARD2" /LENGTH=75 /DNA_ID=CAMNT_0010882181 /DNA_START=148 /DNA_END=375 /DNA_ORIENTATION=-